MKSKIRGRNYIILYDGEKYYSKVNKSKLDRSLKRVIDALEVLNGELEYRNDVSELIMDEVFYDYADDDYSHKKTESKRRWSMRSSSKNSWKHMMMKFQNLKR